MVPLDIIVLKLAQDLTTPQFSIPLCSFPLYPSLSLELLSLISLIYPSQSFSGDFDPAEDYVTQILLAASLVCLLATIVAFSPAE